jgi:hypothetical protein
MALTLQHIFQQHFDDFAARHPLAPYQYRAGCKIRDCAHASDRLFLIAPSFSQTLVNRCKWIDLPVFLFTFHCLKFDGDDDVVPIFAEHPISTRPEVVEITTLADHFGYITDSAVRDKASALLDEIKAWKPGNISVDPIKYAISIKVNGRVFAYFYPRRKHYILATYSIDEEWTEYTVKDDDDLANVKPIVRAAMERRAK